HRKRNEYAAPADRDRFRRSLAAPFLPASGQHDEFTASVPSRVASRSTRPGPGRSQRCGPPIDDDPWVACVTAHVTVTCSDTKRSLVAVSKPAELFGDCTASDVVFLLPTARPG